MWKKYAPALTGLSLLLALPALAADRAGTAKNIGGCIIDRPSPVTEYFKKTILVEIQGKLQLVERDLYWNWKHFREEGRFPPRFPMPRVPPRIKVWQITINGQPYDLNFGGDIEMEKLAQKLKGKTVKLLGRLEDRTGIIRPLKGRGSRALEICRYWPENPVVFVSRLEAVESEYVRETVQVVLRGKLNLNAVFGYPGRPVPAIQVNGQSYVLNFGTDLALSQLAKKLDGKVVLLGGTYGGKQTFTVMCRPQGFQVQVINVTRLENGDGEVVVPLNNAVLKGNLFDSSIIPVPYRDYPAFTVTVQGVTYGLDFGGNKHLWAVAKKLGGKTVVVQGTLEKPRLLGGHLWNMVTVTELKADESEYIHRVETVEIRGKLVFPPLPDCVGYQGLFCLITVNGEAYWLDFQGNKHLSGMASNLKGQTVVITGILRQSSGHGPARVLVDSLKTLPVLPKEQPA